MSKDIRLLRADERPLAKALWKEAFQDTDTFIGWYFENKILDGNSLCMFEGGKLVSIVHMIPYTVRIQGRSVPSAFIAGVATLKSRRGEGLMRTMLLESLALLKSRGIFITHLYPFSHAFYERFGWTAYSFMNRIAANVKAKKTDAPVTETTDPALIAPLYERMMERFDGYVIRGGREWGWRLGELESDGGHCAVLMEDGRACAYMMFYGENGKADIIETVYRSQADIDALLSYVLSHGCRFAEYAVPSRCGGKYGMARIVDAQALLRFFGAQGLLEHYDIADGFASWNSTRNGCSKFLSAAQLAYVVHCGARDNETLEQYFVPQDTCIFEAY